VVDQRAGHRVGLVAIGQRHDHRVTGGAVNEGGDRRWARSEHEIALPMAGHLPGVRLSRSLTDGDHVPDLAATVRTLLSARPSDRTLAPESREVIGTWHSALVSRPFQPPIRAQTSTYTVSASLESRSLRCTVAVSCRLTANSTPRQAFGQN
jgi:hypothetical protein